MKNSDKTEKKDQDRDFCPKCGNEKMAHNEYCWECTDMDKRPEVTKEGGHD